MKNFLKKLNRGVALGIVMLIGLIIFFAADSVAFAKEEPALKDFLDEYLEECAKINLLPEEYRKAGKEVPDNIIEAKIKEGKEFAEKYFTEYQRQKDYNSTMSNVLFGVESMYTENKIQGYTIEDIKYSLVNIASIQKQSATAVRIQFTANLKATASVNARYINLTSPQWGFHNYGMISGAGDEIQDLSTETTYTITLFKINGKWKIADSEGGYYASVVYG